MFAFLKNLRALANDEIARIAQRERRDGFSLQIDLDEGDVVVHRAEVEFDLEVGLVLYGETTLGRIGVIILGLVVAIQVIVERVVGDRKRIGGVVGLNDLTLKMQGVRTGTRRLVDEDATANR